MLENSYLEVRICFCVFIKSRTSRWCISISSFFGLATLGGSKGEKGGGGERSLERSAGLLLLELQFQLRLGLGSNKE